MTVTGHYIKATSYTSGPRVGISLLGPNFSVSVTFRGVGDPNPADTPGLCISSTFGAGERQVARIDAPAGEWVSLRLDVDGAKITVKANDKSPVVVTLPEPPMKIQLGDAGPEGKSFSVSDTVEYLFDDIRVFAGLGADLPDADYLSAGAWFLRHQYYDNAAVEFQRAGVASPHDAGATVAFGYARAFSQGNRLRLTESEQAVAGSPDLFSGHYYLGRYYLDMMRYDDAVRELRRALALAPDSPDVHTWLGLALFRREARLPDEELPTDGEALRHLEAATNLLPTSAEAHEALGLCLLTAKQGLRAQQELTEALELDAALFDPRLILTSLMSPADFNGDEAVANSRLLMDASDSYPYLVQALTSLAPSAASPGTRPAYSATPTATMTGGTLPTVRPPAAAVPGAGVLSETTPQYLSRANRWRDNGMLRPAVEEYRRWLGVLISQGNFGELVGDTLEMAEAYRMAGLDTMQAYALYLPTEPRNTEEREETGAYVEEHGGEFEAAYAKATSYPLSPDRGAWLTYMKGVVEMTTTSPTPRWRAAIGEFKKVEDMVSWPRRGDALIHTGSCYLALSRPYLAEDMFEMALKVYQREARRLAGLGESVASWEMGGLRAHLLNCAQYVNLARQLGGKEPKYDTSQIVLRGALPGGSAVVGGTTAALSQLLRTAALPGGASATTPASSATIRAFSNALVDFLASVYQTQVGEEDRRLIAAESGRNTPSDAVVRQVTSMVRQALNSLIGMSPSQQDAQRRTLRTAMSRGLASAPAGIPSAMLTLVRRLEASAPPLR
jgi:tetratricopeptide (TPR) repeat protein